MSDKKTSLRKNNLPKIEYTENQQNYIRTIIDNHVTVCEGPAGSGKTLIAITVAVEQLKLGHIDKIVISRSLVGVGRDIGFMPGDVESKADPYFVFIKEYLKESLDHDYEVWKKQEKFKLLPIELMRGHTYHNSFLILDEAQNTSPMEIKMFISRMGRNSKCIIIGDKNQQDIHVANGLKFCLEKLGPEENPVRGCGICRLTYDDIKRNPEIKHILKAFDDAGV